MRVLVVEDDQALAVTFRRVLELDRHEVALASTGSGALKLLRSWRPDLMIVDIGLPDFDGRDLTREIRRFSDVLILMATGRGEEVDRVLGLEIGADDYLVKPVSISELRARVRALGRRAARAPERARELVHADLVLDPETHRATKAGDELRLTQKEFEVLRMLMERPGDLLRRAELARAVWGVTEREAGKTLDVHVTLLRKKLGDDAKNPSYIETVRGMGFRLVN